jgi:hypothetical protein
VLRAETLSLLPGFEQQTWNCKTAREGVYLQRRIARGEHYEFSAAGWA